MNIYIKGLGNISPQKTFNAESFLGEPVEYNSTALRCIEPNYTEYINANAARRMGRIIKMGVAASMTCLKDANITQPDAIITGTGLGCIEDTEKFLTSIIENNEQMLTPTSFIQSTHNTVSGQIALMLKCLNYNYTYVHRGFSFENALLDAILQIREGTVNNVLLGGADEMTPNTHTILKRLGHWKKDAVNNLKLAESNSKGSIGGEGASFFVLSNNADGKNYAKINSIATIYKPENFNEIETRINQFLKEAQLEKSDIDLVLLGTNGDKEFDEYYHQLQRNYFKGNDFAYFKHLSGEYHTASSFALWLATKVIDEQTIPEVIQLNKIPKKPIKNILIYNHYRDINHSLMLVQKA